MAARKRKVLVVLSAASVILVWRLSALTEYLPSATQTRPIEATAVPETPEAPVEGRPAKPDPNMKEVWEAQAAVVAQEWGRDPFADMPWLAHADDPQAQPPSDTPARRPPPAAPGLRFTGVSKSGEQWLAVVDGRIVRVGDHLDGSFVVHEITMNSVTLKADGWLYQYGLKSAKATVYPESEAP